MYCLPLKSDVSRMGRAALRSAHTRSGRNIPAATANPIAAAMTVALFHVIFNLTGTAIWWPLRVIPLRIATWYGRLAGQHIRYAFLFLIGVFLIVPLVGITLTEFFIRLR